MLVPPYIDYCSFVVGVTSRPMSSPSLFFFFKVIFGCISFDANVTSYMNDISTFNCGFEGFKLNWGDLTLSIK